MLAAPTACTSAVAGNEIDPIESCDRLAAGPDDPRRQADPVEIERMDAAAAVAACAAAVERDPENARLHYQHGRALLAAGRIMEARKAWRRAILFDYEAAYFDLAQLYLTTEGYLRSERADEITHFLTRAAMGGHGGAAAALGRLYEGEGYLITGINAEEAVPWYALATILGNGSAARRLAQMYRDGTGVVPNAKIAAELFAKAEVLDRAK
ncbi:MAG: hypothetical protein WEB85_14345 [Dongiaceae bacterium]